MFNIKVCNGSTSATFTDMLVIHFTYDCVLDYFLLRFSHAFFSKYFDIS